MMALFERERARARELGAVEMLPAECMAVPGGIEMQPQGPSYRSEMIGIAVPLVILGLVITVLAWRGCTRAAPAMGTAANQQHVLSAVTSDAVMLPVMPISPEDALDKAEAYATKHVNGELAKAYMNYGYSKAVATRLASAYRAKGWHVKEEPGSHGDVWLLFSWPEVKP